MSVATLEALTNELLENVVQHLELHEIRQLRLVSKETCFKATQDFFLSFVVQNNVVVIHEVRPGTLESFTEMKSKPSRNIGDPCHLIRIRQSRLGRPA